MKVIFVSYQAVTILDGGVKTQLWSLKHHLAKLGVEVLFFDSWQEYSFNKVDWVHLFGAHIGTFHLARSLHTLGAKLILTPIFFSQRGAFCIKTISNLSRITSKFCGFRSEYQVVKDICQMAKVIAPNTQKELELIEKSFNIPHKQFQLLPNGVDERFYYADPSLFVKQYGIKDFILYVGHIGWGRKNLLTLLKICQKIDAPLVLIGKVLKNEYAQKCLEIIKSRPFTMLIAEKSLDDPILASAYAACDTFVLPSLFETPGLSALEAGLAGAKIVITQNGGTNEYFKNYAFYINPKSNAEIKRQLQHALAHKKTNELKEHIRQNFLWRFAAEKLLNIYQSIR